MPSKHLSFVVPVRDGQQDIAFRIRSVRAATRELTDRECEILVVDDGSRDETVGMVNQLIAQAPDLRLVGHPRPRGIEAAGQTGLERATGEWVFIQESLGRVRLEDLQLLYRLTKDSSVVAARTYSRVEPIASPLLRRLRQWGGTNPDAVRIDSPLPAAIAAIQLVHRTHLQTLSIQPAGRYRLEGQCHRLTTRQRYAARGATAMPGG